MNIDEDLTLPTRDDKPKLPKQEVLAEPVPDRPRPDPRISPMRPIVPGPGLNDQLILAVLKNKSRSEFEKLINLGADVNCLCPRTSRSLLAYAVNENNHRVVKDLIHLHADVNTVMPGGHTALKIAILNRAHDGTEMARLLLSKGANHVGVREDVGPENVNVTVEYWLDQVPPSSSRNRGRNRTLGPCHCRDHDGHDHDGHDHDGHDHDGHDHYYDQLPWSIG
jgi:ankyrin repeat protein